MKSFLVFVSIFVCISAAPDSKFDGPISNILGLPSNNSATPQKLGVEMLVVNSIENYKKQHPEQKLIEIERSPQQPRVGIQYTAGNPADSYLVAQKTDSTFFSGPNDVVLNLVYPAVGNSGAVVKYIVVNVNQSSNDGRAYITAGGIGQKNIQLVVEATATTYFQYQAYIYGKY